jgi:transcription-repair coupling factor (superfamily II helicase)
MRVSPFSAAKTCSTLPNWSRARRAGKSARATFSADLIDLKPGDYVVHAEHGVARFLGLREIDHGEAQGDYMLLEYAGGAKLYVPLTRMDLVQRFRGAGESVPALDRMGGATWTAPRPASRPRCATWPTSC